MSSFNQVEYFAARETQQRQLEARATLPDTASFHRDLAARYSVLLQQVREHAS